LIFVLSVHLLVYFDKVSQIIIFIFDLLLITYHNMRLIISLSYQPENVYWCIPIYIYNIHCRPIGKTNHKLSLSYLFDFYYSDINEVQWSNERPTPLISLVIFRDLRCEKCLKLCSEPFA